MEYKRVFISRTCFPDANSILALDNADLKPIRTLANSGSISKYSNLNFVGFELTSGRGPNCTRSALSTAEIRIRSELAKVRFVHNSLEKVPQDLFHSVYFEYEENCTHDRLLSLNYAFCHIKRLINPSEPVYVD